MKLFSFVTAFTTLTLSGVFAIVINNPKLARTPVPEDQFIRSRMKNSDGTVSIKKIGYDVGFFGPTQILRGRSANEDLGQDSEISDDYSNQVREVLIEEEDQLVAAEKETNPEIGESTLDSDNIETENTPDNEKRAGHVSFFAGRTNGPKLHWKTASHGPGRCIERISYRGQKANYLKWDVWGTDCSFVLYAGGTCKGKQIFNTNGYNVNSPGDRHERPFESVYFSCR